MTNRQSFPNLFISLPHACSYLPHRSASTLFMDPHYPITPELYGHFNLHGFRRSGDLIYRPHCRDCSACVPVRIAVDKFAMTRGQKRTWKKNADLTVRAAEPKFEREHFELFLRYQERRHPGSSMASPNPEKYMRFLVGRNIKTLFFEMRQAERLVAVAVVDFLPDGLSAVYTFYDPDLPERGLGAFAILWQVEHARGLRLPWLYLGYWIKESPKMAYKIKYQPLEFFQNGAWRSAPEHTTGGLELDLGLAGEFP